MARQSKPWYREQTGTWYARINGKRISLGVNGKENRKEARQAWLRALADESVGKSREKSSATVQSVLNAFLVDAETRMKPITMVQLREFLVPFAQKHGHLKAEALTPAMAESYSRKPSWSPSTRNTFLGRLVTAFRWAERQGLIRRNPLVGIHRPPMTSRGMEALLTPEDHAQLLENASPHFRLLLQVLHASGCRPGEASAITAENFDADAGLVRLADHKTAHKGFRRVIYLTPEAVALLKQQRERFSSGPLLRTSKGTAWTNNTIGQTMGRLRKRAGITAAIAYGYRHTFATDALANGVPDAQVAELLGHAGTAMLHKHYSHLGAKAQVLKNALGNVR